MKYERRANARHRIAIDAVLDTPDGRRMTLRLRDVSVGGAFLEKTDPATPLPRIGSAVQMTIRYQSEHGTEVEKVRARIVRVNPAGLAIRFLPNPATEEDEVA
jgi:hypothetical protein